jgi:hypothetical protein
METLIGAVQTAEKALMGDKSQSGEEPVSGVKGEGTASDPYDAGNASDQPGESSKGTAAEGGRVTTEEPQSTGRRETPQEHIAGELARHTTTGVETSSNTRLETSPNGQPTLSPQARADLGELPQGISPCEDDQTEPKGVDHGHRDGYVKSTGFAADGGDFDAKRPGAGREADRLREEQGLAIGHEQKSSTGGTEGAPGGKPSGTGSHGGISKVREKLHIGKHHS